MSREGYRYLAKCLAASMAANLMDNSIEHEMRTFKDREPGELYYALASLLLSALVGKVPEDIGKLAVALEGHPK